MHEYYKIPVIILDKKNINNYNNVELEFENIITKKTFYGYKEIIRGIRFIKKSVLKAEKIYGSTTLTINDKDILKSIDKHGVCFIIDKQFDNLIKLATTS